jgi:shikimate kinase
MEEYKSLITELSDRSIVLVGLMGAGKTCVGRSLSGILGLPFVDADQEIEMAAGCSIEYFFERYGEEEFRAGEVLVIRRLLGNGPQVLATGGGAFMNADTRQSIVDHGVSVWLKASLDVLTNRTSHRGKRPILKNGDPKEILKGLIKQRYPVYETAQITIETGNENVDVTCHKVIEALNHYSPHVEIPESIKQ